MGRMRNLLIPGVDKTLLVRDAVKTMPDLTRRRFISGGASLGALTLLTGCDVVGQFFGRRDAEAGLEIQRRRAGVDVQSQCDGADLSGKRRSQSRFRSTPITTSTTRRRSTARPGSSKCSGLVENKKPWTLEELYKLPQVKQVTRHICVEGWSAIGSWTGTPLRDFLKIVGADTRAKYVWFQCADKDGYNSPLDMRTALHAQTQMTFKFGDEILPRAYGFPMKIRVPTKLGFKNPKYVMSMEVTNDYKGGFWEDQGYNSFSGS